MNLQKLRPYRQMLDFARQFPGAWDKANNLILGMPLPDGNVFERWPTYCLLPISLWRTCILLPGKQPKGIVAADLHMAQAAAIGSWRYSQGYYRFDSDVYTGLMTMPLGGKLPLEAFLRLPEWCVYVETPYLAFASMPLAGVYAHLEYDVKRDEPELRLLLDLDTDRTSSFIPIPIHLANITLRESLDMLFDNADRMAENIGVEKQLDASSLAKLKSMMEDLTTIILSLLLYLCSDEPEIDDERDPTATPKINRPVRTKHGGRVFIPERPRIWNVGKPTGSRFRSAITAYYERHGKMPNIRQARWHDCGSESHGDERKFGYKWVPPAVVGDIEEINDG